MNKILIFFIAFFLLGGAKDKTASKKEIINFDEKIREYYVSLPEDTSNDPPHSDVGLAVTTLTKP